MRTGGEEEHSLSLTIATVVLFCNKHDYISRDLRSSYEVLVSQVKSIVACIWSAAVERLRNGAVSVCLSVCLSVASNDSGSDVQQLACRGWGAGSRYRSTELRLRVASML